MLIRFFFLRGGRGAVGNFGGFQNWSVNIKWNQRKPWTMEGKVSGEVNLMRRSKKLYGEIFYFILFWFYAGNEWFDTKFVYFLNHTNLIKEGVEGFFIFFNFYYFIVQSHKCPRVEKSGALIYFVKFRWINNCKSKKKNIYVFLIKCGTLNDWWIFVIKINEKPGAKELFFSWWIDNSSWLLPFLVFFGYLTSIYNMERYLRGPNIMKKIDNIDNKQGLFTK